MTCISGGFLAFALLVTFAGQVKQVSCETSKQGGSDDDLGPVGDVTISSVETASVTVRWTQVEPKGDGYFFQLFALNGTILKNDSINRNDATEHTIEGLDPGTEYNVSVAAWQFCANDTTRNVGSASFGTETAKTYLTAPTDLTQSGVDVTSISMSWTVAADSEYEYRINCTAVGDSGNSNTVNVFGSSGTCTGLNGGTLYEVTIETFRAGFQMEDCSTCTFSNVTVPNPVDDVSVTTEGPKAINVSWTPSDNPNITHYVFTVSDSKACVGTVIINVDQDEPHQNLAECTNGVNLNCSSSTDTSCVVNNLFPCTNYTVEMYVINTAGVSNSTTGQGETEVGDVEDQISNFTQVANTSTSVALKWDPVKAPGNCTVHYYRIDYTYTDCKNESEIAHSIDDLPCCDHNIMKLPYENWNYTVTIKAFTRDDGDGTASEASIVATTAEDAPGPPTGFSASRNGDFNITLDWQPPQECEENGVIRTYNLSCICEEPDRPGTRVNDSTVEIDGSETSHELYFGPYRSCTFYLRAKTIELGEATEASANTSQSTPGPIKSISVESANSSFLYLTWDEPDERNGPIVLYTVEWQSNGVANESKSADVDRENVTDSSIELSGLIAFNTYTVTVTAWTTIGEGIPFSKNIDTGVSAPGSVTNIQVDLNTEYFIVSWDQAEKTGPTNFSVSVCEVKVEDCQNDLECSVSNVTGYDTNFANVTGLIPNWPYTVSVTAVTSAGSSDVDAGRNFTTNSTDPPMVQGFAVSRVEDDCSKITASWTALTCKDQYADITGYKIEVVNGTEEIVTSVELDQGDPNFTDILAEAKADTVFNVFVYAIADGYDGERATEHVTTSVCAPDYPEGDNDTYTGVVTPTSDTVPENPRRQFYIFLNDNFLTDTTQGPIVEKGYIVAQDSEDLKMEQEKLIPSNFKAAYNLTWRQVQDDAVTLPYRATPDDWAPKKTESRKRAADDAVYELVGEGKDCTGQMLYCNGYLKPGRTYRVKVFACTEAFCSVTTYSDSFRTVPDEDDEGGGSVAVAVAVPLVLIVVIAAAVAGLIYKRRYYNKSTRKPADIPNGLHIVNPSDNPGFEMDEPPKPIPKDEFEETVQHLRKDSDLLFSEEYKLLKDISPRMDWDVAELPYNRVKNRYTNILAYDHSRVKLIPTEDEEEGSDYINANYMPGFNSKREFIAAQGPLPSTKDDFWRMVWEQNVPIIVMLTKCVERGRQKCDQYWPSDTEPVFYGDLQIQVKSESVLDHYTIRIIEIKLGEKGKVIKQFHFTTWPDMGSPDTTDALLSFVKAVRSHMKPDMVGPMMVHCSAGVGRTGTFVCVDTLLHRIAEDDTIDIFGMVLNLRKYRTNIVQTEDQYIYIHECMNDALRRGIVLKPSVYQHDDSPVYANVDTSDIQLEDNLYENVEIRSPVHVAHIVESDEEENPEEAPLTQDSDTYEEDRV